MREEHNHQRPSEPGGVDDRTGSEPRRIPVRVLLVEDSPVDAELIIHTLGRGGYEPSSERVDTEEGMREALYSRQWDIVLADYSMPGWSGLDALELFKKEGPDIPFILVSGTIGEDTAVEAMRAGAHDYIMKQNLKRLLPAVERELREARVRMEFRCQEERLRESEENYRLFVENFRGIAFQWGRDLTSVFIHGALEEICGYADAELMSGEPGWEQVVHPEDRAIAFGGLSEETATGEPTEKEFRIVRKDGSIAWVHMVRWNISDSAGKRAGVQGAMYDITERKRMEEELVNLNRALENKVQECSSGAAEGGNMQGHHDEAALDNG